MFNITESSIRNIFSVHLGLKTIDARWITKILSDYDKKRRFESATEFLDRYRKNWTHYERG